VQPKILKTSKQGTQMVPKFPGKLSRKSEKIVEYPKSEPLN